MSNKAFVTIHPSTYPRSVSASLVGCCRSPSHQQCSKSLPGGPQGAPRAARMCNPSSESWNYPGVFAQLYVAGTPLRGGVPEACCQMPEPPQAAAFKAKIAVALLRATSLSSSTYL